MVILMLVTECRTLTCNKVTVRWCTWIYFNPCQETKDGRPASTAISTHKKLHQYLAGLLNVNRMVTWSVDSRNKCSAKKKKGKKEIYQMKSEDKSEEMIRNQWESRTVEYKQAIRLWTLKWPTVARSDCNQQTPRSHYLNPFILYGYKTGENVS